MKDSVLNAFLPSGRHLLIDTKAPRKSHKKEKVTKEELMGDMETDPHKIFRKRCIAEKPKKAEVVADIKRFIEAAEKDL